MEINFKFISDTFQELIKPELEKILQNKLV